MIRIGIVGLGANCRLRHVPGFLACQDVQIAGICNRRSESTEAAAQEFNIPKTYGHWNNMIGDPDIDAVLIGTWPYLHCPITVAALKAGKHILTEARMARNLDEAQQMLAASQSHPDLVAQIVPSPFGLRIHQVVQDLLQESFLGDLREFVLLGMDANLADPTVPLHWRQSAEHSGINMLAMGIFHETLTRWIPAPVRVMSQTTIFTAERPKHAELGIGYVGTPDSVHVMTQLPNGARGIYHLSGVTHFGPEKQIHLYGTAGTIKCLFDGKEKLLAGQAGNAELREIAIPEEKAGGWQVEADFIDSIRNGTPVRFTDFAAGVRYMEFTDAVARSAETGVAVDLS